MRKLILLPAILLLATSVGWASDIATLLEQNGSNTASNTLSSHQFAMTSMAYMLGDLTGPQAVVEFNAMLAQNGHAALTAQEQADLSAMKTHFNALPNSDAELKYFFRLEYYTMRLQYGLISVATWDTAMGL